MKLFKEYTDLVDLYDKDPTHPQTQNEFVNICYLPSFYSRFGLNTDKQKLALSSKHLYTMQVSKDVGYYNESADTHYHNLKKDTMLSIPDLLLKPNFVFYDSSFYDKQKDLNPSSLLAILPKKYAKINTKTKEATKSLLVAYINEPLNPLEKTTILATSFPREKIENYLIWLLKNNRLLYVDEDILNKKKSLSTVYPGNLFPNIATHSNGETRNSMAFLGSLNNNIRQYRENVNLKRMEVSGLYLESIPENERTELVCNKAFSNNPYSVNYFPEPLREQTYRTKVFESLDKKTIQSIPNELFIPSLHYFLQNTKQCGHQSKIIYNTVKKRLSENQKDILSQAVNPDKEPDEKEIVRAFELWSEGNLYEKLKASPVPQSINTVSDSVLSFENNKSDILDVIGLRFDVDSLGNPTLEGYKSFSKVMEAYSDKRYETARYLFVKDGQIVRHIAVSSQTPSSTVIKPDSRFLHDLKTYAENTDSKIVFLHNHPSGYVEPSEADIELTNYLSNFFREPDGKNYLSGHVILDHGTYGLFTSESSQWNALIDGNLKPLSEIQNNYSLELTKHGKRATFTGNDYSISKKSLMELSEYARQCDSNDLWNVKDWTPSFLMTGNGIITSLEYINCNEFKKESFLSEKLKNLGRIYGSENIIMLPRTDEQFLLCERFAQLSGMVKEIYHEKPDGSHEFSAYKNGNIFQNLKVDDILMEDSEKYKAEVDRKIFEENMKINSVEIKEDKSMENTNESIEKKTEAMKKIKASQFMEELVGFTGSSKKIASGMLDYLYHRSISEEVTGQPSSYETLFSNDVTQYLASDINRDGIMKKLNEYNDVIIEFDPDGLKSYMDSINFFDRKSPGDLVKEVEFFSEAYDEALKNEVINVTENKYKYTKDSELLSEYLKSPSGENSNLSKDEWLFAHSDYFYNHYADSFGENTEPDKDFIRGLLDNSNMSPARKEEWQTYNQEISEAYKKLEEQNKSMEEHDLQANSSETELSEQPVIVNTEPEEITHDKDTLSVAADETIIPAREKNIDDFIEQMQSNDGMSEAAIKDDISSLDNPLPGYPDEDESLEENIDDESVSQDISSDLNPETDRIDGLSENPVDSVTEKPEINISTDSIQQPPEPENLPDALKRIRELEETIKTMNEAHQKDMENLKKSIVDEMKQAFQQQMEQMSQMLKESNKQNEILQNKLNAVQNPQSAEKDISANDSMSHNSSPSGPVNLVNKDGFGRDTAYVVNQKVPRFGMKDTPKKGETTIIENAVFKKFIQDEKNFSNNKVILSVTDEKGNNKEIEISEQRYQGIINAVQDYENRKNTVEVDSWHWEKNIQDYKERMCIDSDSTKMNNSDNFFHNFEVLCRHYAHNQQEALSIAGRLVNDMPPHDREKWNRARKDYDNKYGKGAYDRVLLEKFENNSKMREKEPLDELPKNLDIVLNDKDKHLFNLNAQEVFLKNGEEIGKTGIRVGDSIPISFTLRNPVTGVKIKTPKDEWKIAKVSQNLFENQAVLYNEKTKAVTKLPLKDLEKHIMKINRNVTKEKNKQVKKDRNYVGLSM
ncbi:MAG: hypothetical protein J5527_09360 [Treponema sp.]|nr:hypothetical protein [Treponema sp.]